MIKKKFIDGEMVERCKNIGNGEEIKIMREGIMRVLEKEGIENLSIKRLEIENKKRKKKKKRVEKKDGRSLKEGKNIIEDRDLLEVEKLDEKIVKEIEKEEKDDRK